MGNKTVQTLLDLCTELKNKRERLQQQWQQAQYYLNDQHQHLNQEVSTLRSHCSELTREFDFLQSDLTQLHQLRQNGGIATSVPLTTSNSKALTQLTQDMANHYTSLQQEVECLHADWGHLSGELLQLQALWQQQKTLDQTHVLNENLQQQTAQLQAAETNYQQLLTENQQQLAHIQKLTAELQTLQNQSSSLKEEVSGVNADLSELQQQLQSQHSSREEHLATLQNESQAQQAALEAELNQAQSNLEQAQAQQAALEAELSQAQTNLEQTQAQQAALEAELNQAQSNLEQAQAQQAALEAELSQAQTNLEQAQEQHATREADIVRGKNLLLFTLQNESQAQQAALEAELSQAQSNLEQAQAQQTALEAELSQAQTNLEQAQAQQATREADLTHDLEQKGQHVQELQAALAHQQNLTQQLSAQMADCQQQFMTMAEHTHLLQADLSSLSAEIQLLPDLSANNQYLQAEMQKYQKGLAYLQNQLAMAQLAIEQPTQRLQELEQQQNDAQATLQQCQQRLDDNRTAMQNLAAKLPEVQAELATKNELLDKFGSYANESFLTEVERLKGLLENYEQELLTAQQLEKELLEDQQEQIQNQHLFSGEFIRAQNDLKLATDRVEQLQRYLQAFEAAQTDENVGIDTLLQKQIQALETERQHHLTEIAALKAQLAAPTPHGTPAKPSVGVSQAEYDHLKAELEQLKSAIKETAQQVDDNLTSFEDEIELPEDFIIEDIAPDAVSGSIFNQFEKLGSLLGHFREDHQIEDTEPLTIEEDTSSAPQPVQQEILLYVDQQPFMNEWDEQLDTYLQDFHLKHHWIERSQLDQLSTMPAKGLVCLLQATQSLPHEVVQQLQASGIPYIKHYLSNLTRLKIDLYDAFVR